MGAADGERRRKWILSEPELEGAYCKWNNNGGKIKPAADLSRPAVTASRPSLGAIYEGDEEDEEEEEEKEGGGEITEDDVIQAFSHFTLALTGGQRLVVDLQGTVLFVSALHCTALHCAVLHCCVVLCCVVR